MGVNGEAPACQPPTRSPSPHRVRMAVAEVQMRAAGGPCARRGMLDAGARSRHDVVGTHRSKERLSAAAQRCRAGLVVVSLKDVSHVVPEIGRRRGRGPEVSPSRLPAAPPPCVPAASRRWPRRLGGAARAPCRLPVSSGCCVTAPAAYPPRALGSLPPPLGGGSMLQRCGFRCLLFPVSPVTNF